LPWVELHRSTLRKNVRALSQGAGGRSVCVVVKHHGYGMGAFNVAGATQDMPEVWGYMTTRPQEAMDMVRRGVRKPVLLHSPVDSTTAVAMVRAGVHLAVGAKDDAASLRRVRDAAGRPVRVHLDIDTGLNRQGMPDGLASAWASRLWASGAVEIRGTASYFATGPVDDWATKTDPFELEQISRFEGVVDSMRRAGVPVGHRHMVTSISYFQHPQAYFDMVRCGAVVYGGYPHDAWLKEDRFGLEPVYDLRCRIAQVTQVKAGQGIGYAQAFRPSEDVWIATLLAGYLDGYRVEPTPQANIQALVNGRLRRVVSLTGTHTVLVLGRDRDADVGDVVTLLGRADPAIRPERVLGAYASYYFSPELARVVVD